MRRDMDVTETGETAWSSQDADAQRGSSAGQLDEWVLHDLLNPMTAVVGQLEMLQDMVEREPGERFAARLDECAASAQELAEMLVNLRCLAQLRAGRIRNEPTSVSVARLLEPFCGTSPLPNDAVVHVSPSARGLELRMRDVAGVLGRALSVLVQAAVRLSADRRVTVDAARVPETQLVRITCGYVGSTLPEAVREVLLSPALARVQREHRLRFDRGRGMELVQRVVQLLEGAVRYSATADGGEFSILAPMGEPTEADGRR